MIPCIFYSYLYIACPFEAIPLGTGYGLSNYSPDDQIYTKEMLLAPPVKRVPVAPREPYDTPLAVWERES